MKKYYLHYNNFSKETIKAIKKMVKEGFYKKDDISKSKNIRDLNNELSSIYKIKEPEIIFGSKNFSPCYDTINNTIYLTNLSIISFLHEFKHSIQFNKKETNNEKLARGWSLSLFKQACPITFKKAVKEGKVFFAN